jgi:hypothetical protein
MTPRAGRSGIFLRLKESLPFAALIVSVAAVLISYSSGERQNVLAIRPVLVFEYQTSGWRIHNVGAGPAMDVIFTRLRGTEVHEHVRLPALAKDAAFQLHFARSDNVHRFAATYRDIAGRPYTSHSEHDVSVTVKGFVVPRPSDASVVQWWKLPEREL